MAKVYDTEGRLFFTQTMGDDKGLISMDYSDYEGLLAVGIMDEQIDLTLNKTHSVNDYTRQASEHKMRASLWTIKIDATHPKPQIGLSEQDVVELVKRGFSDGDKVSVHVEGLPYRIPCEANYDGLKLDIDL